MNPLPDRSLQEAVDSASEDPIFVQSDDWVPDDWWTLFQDEQLNEFIAIVLQNNPTLQMAGARIRSAQATANKVRSALYPTIAWNADVQREKLSTTGVFPISSTGATSSSSQIQPVPINPSVIPIYFTQTETALNLSWDFDIWCKNRNLLQAAIGEFEASFADEAFTRLSLSIAVSEVYFLLQTNYQRLKIAQEILRNREEYFELVEKRVQHNLDDNLIFYAALNNLIAAKQSLLMIEANIIVEENQLKAYLARDFLDNIADVLIAQKPLPKVPLPDAIPMNLLCHRPDIISQLYLIQSAGRRIKVAIAGFYPDLNLMAFGGFQTIHIQKLFQGQSTYGDVQLATSLPLFTGGLLRANLWEAEIDYDLAILKYNQLVLDAVKEVLDGIALVKNNHKQLEEFKQQMEQQEEIFRLTDLRMQNNIGSTLDYLNSQQEVFVIQDKEVTSLGNTLHSILELIKALGGGYNAYCEPECNDNIACDKEIIICRTLKQ